MKLNNLTLQEIEELSNRLHQLNPYPNEEKTRIYSLDLSCPSCGHKCIVKNGHDYGIQRYKCKYCGRNFTITSNTIFHSTKLSYEQWTLFIECELKHLTLKKTASIIGVSQTTCFSMRHKLYDIIEQMNRNTV